MVITQNCPIPSSTGSPPVGECPKRGSECRMRNDCRRLRRRCFRILGLALITVTPTPMVRADTPPVLHLGSKADTETVILAELPALLLRDDGLGVVHRRRMGG